MVDFNIFLTADNHFGHANIIRFCNRPFANADEMDERMIASWNKVVSDSDFVYHLGDFTMGNKKQARRYFNRLNGNIIILGNPWHHDKRWIKNTWDSPIANHVLTGMPIEVIVHDKMPITLCHYAMDRWERSHYGAYHAFGHSHNQYHPDNLSMDIGVDSAFALLGSYRPFRLEEFVSIMEKKASVQSK